MPFCERMCTFCGCNKRITVNHSVEIPYIDTLLAEWKIYIDHLPEKPRIRELHLGGGTPTFFAPTNLTRLIQGILETATTTKDFEFSLEAHPNVTSLEHLETLRKNGFTRISFGVQDFNPEIQKVINRHQTYGQTALLTEHSRKIGFESINFDFVYGLPLQDLNCLKENMKKVAVLKPERIALYSYAHVPWKSPGQRGFSDKDLPRNEEKRALYEAGKKDLEDLGYFEIGMDHFALPGDALYEAMINKSLHRNFMGYTPGYTKLMIGLGVSSISDSWDLFMQNNKVFEDYVAQIETGRLPILKGHFLTEEEKIIRKHILNIMCHFETDWSQPETRFESFDQGLYRLHELENDGLVEVVGSGLQVTEPGRPFVRNICMAIDPYLWEKQPGMRLFSETV